MTIALDWASLVSDVAESGCAVRRDFLPPALISALRVDLEQSHSQQHFVAGTLGRERVVGAQLRSDEICWFDAARPTLPQQTFLQHIELFRQELNKQLQLGVFEFESHYTVYRPGSHYARHVDQQRGSDARVVSVIAYLNESWCGLDGGALRVYFPTHTLDILPEAGTLVAFLSAKLEHEVLVPYRERYSVTGWLRRRADHV